LFWFNAVKKLIFFAIKLKNEGNFVEKYSLQSQNLRGGFALKYQVLRILSSKVGGRVANPYNLRRKMGGGTLIAQRFLLIVYFTHRLKLLL